MSANRRIPGEPEILSAEQQKASARKNTAARGPRGMRPADKPKDFRGSLRKLVHELSEQRFLLLLVLLFSIGSATFIIIGPKLTGRITQEIFRGLVARVTGQGEGIDFAYIAGFIYRLLLLYGLAALFQFATGMIMTSIAQRVSYRLRDAISRKIHRLPMQFFDRTPHGEVLSRVTNDVDTLSQSLNQSLTQAISSFVTLIGVIIMMATINVPMTLTTLLILPLSMFLLSRVMKRSQKYFVQQQKTLGVINSQVEETFGGHLVVQAYNGEEAAAERFDQANQALHDSAWKSQFFGGLMMPLMSLIGNIGYVVVAIFGGLLAVRRVIDVGDIQSFIQYVQSFNQPIMQAAQIANLLQSTVAAAERVFAFLEEPEVEPDTEHPVDPASLTGRITFDHVRFGYSPERIIINDFSAVVEPGQKIAIVGHTGAGKTTIVKLLLRFYELNGGAIRIDGHDIRDFRRADLRRIFGMVLQDTWLFSGTIAENIRYGRLEATDEEIRTAAAAALAHNFIRTLPGGYEMLINEEAANISAGQRQLLTIARAILADPRVLILDEATSSVDTRTEVQIQQAMDILMRGRTSFIIAHRLSTIRNADRILVMADGDIIEQGTHAELLAAGGHYAQLYQAQFTRS